VTAPVCFTASHTLAIENGEGVHRRRDVYQGELYLGSFDPIHDPVTRVGGKVIVSTSQRLLVALDEYTIRNHMGGRS